MVDGDMFDEDFMDIDLQLEARKESILGDYEATSELHAEKIRQLARALAAKSTLNLGKSREMMVASGVVGGALKRNFEPTKESCDFEAILDKYERTVKHVGASGGYPLFLLWVAGDGAKLKKEVSNLRCCD